MPEPHGLNLPGRRTRSKPIGRLRGNRSVRRGWCDTRARPACSCVAASCDRLSPGKGATPPERGARGRRVSLDGGSEGERDRCWVVHDFPYSPASLSPAKPTIGAPPHACGGPKPTASAPLPGAGLTSMRSALDGATTGTARPYGEIKPTHNPRSSSRGTRYGWRSSSAPRR
jgi:hypothetical protein